MVRKSIYKGSVDFLVSAAVLRNIGKIMVSSLFKKAVTGTLVPHLWSKTPTHHLNFSFRGFILLLWGKTATPQMLSAFHSYQGHLTASTCVSARGQSLAMELTEAGHRAGPLWNLASSNEWNSHPFINDKRIRRRMPWAYLALAWDNSEVSSLSPRSS